MMTEPEKVALVQTILGDEGVDVDVVRAYLSIAKDKVLQRLYPFGEGNEIPSKYDVTHCELCVRLIARRGGEGERRHNENGIDRTYSSVDDEDILSRITPYVKVV